MRILYSIYFAFPLVILGNQLHEMIILLLIYYPLFILLIWNISRTTKLLIFDLDNQLLIVKNNNVLGQLLRRPVKIEFSGITDFEIEYTTNRNKSKTYNIVYLIGTENKKVLLLKLVALGASKKNGNRFVELVNALISFNKQ